MKTAVPFIAGVSIGIIGMSMYATNHPITSPTQENKQSDKTILAPLFGTPSKYKRFDEVLSVLRKGYYGTGVDESKMLEGALKGFVEAIGDPHTVYFPPEENKIFEDTLKGENTDLEGIGAVVGKKKDGVVIDEVIKGSPAFKAGLLPQDLIIQINGESTKEMDLKTAISKIRGKKGTVVTLTILRGENIKKIEVTRDKLVIPSVSHKVDTFSGHKIGYISVSVFGSDTLENFRDAVLDVKKQNVAGVVLDVRGNGGGYLEVAKDMASFLIPEGKVIVTAKYADENDELRSTGKDGLYTVPVVVLIDGWSASASEIIALALKEQVNAKVVGTKSYGKGTIQTLYDGFKDGSSLKFTVGKWYSPNGLNIDKTGITPDITVEFNKEKYEKENVDNQLLSAEEAVVNLIKK